MSASCETRTLTVSDARRLVSLACRGPSMYNSQPWAWRIGHGGVELYADRARQLPAADPDGRNLVIGCGAALHHFQVAARASGWAPSVSRFPDPGDPDLLAEILLTPETGTPRHAADLAALQSRSTDRRRFTSWPVPDERVAQLAEAATAWGVYGVPLLEVSERFRVELLVSRALRLQARDASVAAEQRHWLDRRDSAGVPLDTVPVGTATVESHRSRFGNGSLADPGRDIESTDGLVVICGDSDDPAAWLRAGEGLSALWLRAVGEGLSVVPLTQPIEVPETRNALQHDVLGGLVVPLLLVRVGWQAIGRSQWRSDTAPIRRRGARVVTRRWLLACTTAEAIGMTAAAAAARGATALEGQATAWLGLALVVLGGLVEGTALGWLQSWALADLLGRRGRARWLVGTIVVAGLGWAAASAPAALSSGSSGSSDAAPPLVLVLVGAAALGAVMGTVLGVAQSWALRGRARHPRRWVLGSVASWSVAMPVIFLGATTVPAAWPFGVVVLVGTVTGLAAGLTLGVVGGAFLATLDGPPLRHRVVLAVLGTGLVHPADRDGDGALIGLAVTGSRSGRVFRFPVSAARPAPRRLLVLPGHPERKTWWRNLDTRPALDVLVDGAWHPATGRVLRCGEPAWDDARAAYAARFPASFSGQPLVVIDLTPGWDQSPGSSGRSAVGALPRDP